jgi:protein ImuB
MDWIALQPAHEDQAPAWGWQALRLTPRVVRVDEAWLLEVSGSLRLFGGRAALRRALLADGRPAGLAPAAWAGGPTSPIALARLRLQVEGRAPPAQVPEGLPLALLTAARPHVPLLARSGLRTWGQLRALPRAPVARRFGAALLHALDRAWGQVPDVYDWLVAPEVFDQALDLPAVASSAPELMAASWRLLCELQLWLRVRQQGVLAFGLEWQLDLRRLDGVELPPHGQLVVRTAEPVQSMDHLGRLLQERLARTTLLAPARRVRLYSLQTLPWAGAVRTLLPDEVREGERLHQLVERLSARLGPDQVLRPRLQADWRPEAMQGWLPAQETALAPGSHAPTERMPRPTPAVTAVVVSQAHALHPPWLVEPALRLTLREERPWYQGPLQLLTRRHRVETGWWEAGGAVVRDYCIARSARAGLLWIYCEHALPVGSQPPRWYLQGFYA